MCDLQAITQGKFTQCTQSAHVVAEVVAAASSLVPKKIIMKKEVRSYMEYNISITQHAHLTA